MGTDAVQSEDRQAALAILGLVADDLTRLVRSVPEVDWEHPTPCTEWTVRDLTDHVTGGNRFTIRILRGDSSAEAMAAAQRSFADGQDARLSLVTSTRELEDRFVVPGVLDRTCHHIDDDLSGLEVLRLRLHDLLIHTWDAAEALRAEPFEIRPEVARWALADIAADTFVARHFGLTPTTAGDGGSDQDRLLATFGRRRP